MQKFLVGGIARGTIPSIVDPADGITPVTPSALTALVIKNGTDTADSVTITAVGGGRTGVYKWSYDPAGDAESDIYSLVFTITIGGDPYYHTVDLIACVAERGTDGASTFDHTTDEVTTDADSRTASRADVSGLATQADVTDAQTALATTIDGKLTAERLTTIDNLPSAWPTNLELLSIDGSGRITLNTTQMTELLSDDDIGAIATAIIESFNQTSDVPIITQATATVDRLKADATFLALVADALAAKTAAQAANTATTALSLALDSVPNATENALAAREELAPELALIDVAISSISAGSGLDEAGIRAAIGLESANLDTQLAEIETALGNASNPATGGGGTEVGPLPNTENLEDLLNDVKLLAESSKVFAEIAASNSIRKR